MTRSDGTAGAVSVDWTTGTYSGSATAGTNFTASSGTLQWAAGNATSRTVTVAILHALGTQPERSLGLNLTNPLGGAGIDDGTPDRSYATITIRDVDGAAFDTITASTATTTVHELAGSAVISFVRTGSGSGPAGIQILSDPRTALPVIQYGSPSASSLTWADGELGPKSLTLPIVHDGVASGNTSMSITAGIAYGNAAVSASQPNTIVTTLDDDGPAPSGAVTSSAANSSSAGGCGAGGLAWVGLGLLACMGWQRPRAWRA